MSSEQMRQLFEEYFYYILFAGVAIGLLLGTIPLVLGIRRKKRNLGIIGFVVAGAAGALSPILSLIVVAVFAVLIIKKSVVEKAADVERTLHNDLSE